MSDENSTVGIEAEMVDMTKTLMRIASALERIADMVELKSPDGELLGIPVDITVRGALDGGSLPVHLVPDDELNSPQIPPAIVPRASTNAANTPVARGQEGKAP